MADTAAAGDLQTAAFRYFSHTNYISKRILNEERLFIKHLGNQWNELPAKHREDLLDLLFVEDGVRCDYRSDDSSRAGVGDVQESFPRLFINSGNKINVDFENDLWTWRDEHSGPFSWMSRSQQDLTLLDLESDNISKPQPKSLRTDTDDDKVQKAAEPQFTQPSSSWCHSIVDDFRKNEQNIVLTPCNSMNLLGVTTDSSNDDDVHLDGQEHPAASCPPRAPSQNKVTEGTDSALASDKKSDAKDRKRSPSPKKILRTGSFKKSPSKNVDNGEKKLIVDDEPEVDDRTNAFSNPVMESEWSNFVGPTADDLSSNTQDSPVTYAPESLTMDRGSDPGYSPKGDYISLIEQTDSPAQASSKSVTSPAISDWSAQSTPDHTTHLLKGMQSPVHLRKPKPQPVQLSDYCKDLPAELETEGSEEVLRVEKEGDTIVVTTKVENKRDSDIPRTGFDFLDDW